MNTRPASTVGSRPHPPFVDQLSCRRGDFVEHLIEDGVRIGHAALAQSLRDVVLVQWAVFGQDFLKGLYRVERFRHGDHLMPSLSRSVSVVLRAIVGDIVGDRQHLSAVEKIWV